MRAVALPSVHGMRGDDEGLGTAADRLPLGGGEGLSAGTWVPHAVTSAVPGPGAAMPAAERRIPVWAQPWLQPAAGRQLGWLAGVVAVVLAGSAWLLLHRPGSAPPAPVAASTSTAALPPAPPQMQIVVDVGGRVRHPGLVTLSAGARVADALRAAGGALRAADVATLDLAARVSDGQLLLIGVPQPVAAPGGDGSAPVSLSSATAEQLDTLPGIGPVLAKRIVDWRQAHGGFTSISQLEQVPGVGPRIFERLKSLVVL